MSEAGDARAMSGWLRRFKWALGAMPSPEREDIVAEARAHLAERVAAGATVTDALNAFGTPEGYARSFVEEMELARALTGQGFRPLLGAVVRRVHSSAVAAAAFLAVLVLSALAIGVVVTALLKLGDPTQYGLWASREFFFFGSGAVGGRELLGPWIYPLAPVTVGLAWVLARLMLLGAVRAIQRAR